MQPIIIPPASPTKEEKLERIGVSQREASEMLGVSVPTMIKYTELGYLPHVRLGSRVIYSVAGLRRFVEGKETPGDYNDHRFRYLTPLPFFRNPC